MSSKVRWTFALPWLLVLIALLFAAQMVLARFASSAVEDMGEESLDAKVEVGRASVSLVSRRLSLRRFSVASASDPTRCLVEVDRCDLHFEPAALLRKRLVIDHGIASGVRFGAPCDEHARAQPDDAMPIRRDTWLDAHAADAARDWLGRLDERFHGKLLEQLESIRLTEQLLARWPQQHEAIRDRAAKLRARTSELQAAVRKAQINPLRHVEFLEAMPEQIERLREDLVRLSDELQNLPSAIDADRRAIVAARKHDEQFLREQLQFERIDASSLTAYLLEQQLSGPLADTLDWLHWMRRVAPAEPAPRPSRRRGQEVVFAGCERAPDVLLRTLEIRGTGRIGQQTLPLAGTLTDWTDQPRLHGQPTRLRLTSASPVPLELQATIDRTGPVPRDQLLIDCDRLLLPNVQWGSTDQLRLAVAPSAATVNVSLRLEGERLSGDIQLVQKQVELTPQLSDELDRAGVERELTEALSRVEALATRVSLGGTLSAPQCRIWSNVGPAVAEALDRALTRSVERYRRQLLADSQQRVDERLAQLDRQLSEAQAAFLSQLAESSGHLTALADEQRRPLRLTIEHMGRRLPADSLFR